MASDGPDPQSLNTWQDAFQYPIPTVRRVEQELRRDIASNKEKLRAVVGARYRELVGTAETIVSMSRDMEDVDTTLGDIGRRCNPRLIGKKYAHFNQINGGTSDQDATKRALAAQLALLHRCSVLISKMLRKRGSPLLIAKLLVITRPLHKNLSEQQSVPPFLETLRNQLASLKLGLRSRIDKRLASAKSTVDEVIEALAAYCLATSSSSDDAVAYYHKTRLDVIGDRLEVAGASGENILVALRLYIQTLQFSKTLLSRRFTDVLSKLKSRPLFTDPDVRNVDDLALDVLGRWVPTDIVHFTPWVKLNELSKQDAERTIKKWSKTAFDEFVRRSQATLTIWVDFSQLLQLRKETLELWLCSSSSTPTHGALQVLEGTRTVFNSRLTNILSDRANALEIFGQAVTSAISSWGDGEHGSTQSMWDHELVSCDYSNGAAAFREAIMDRLLGRDADISSVTEKYRAWLLTIGSLRESIDALREVRWPDILDEAADEDIDIDIAAILNEDDRQLLWDALHAAVEQAFDTLQTSFGNTFKFIGDSNRGEKVAFMLKLIRLVRRDLPHEFILTDTQFSNDIIPVLQDILAAEVIATTRPLIFATSLDPRTKTPAGRMLWEGAPELPVQPSPSTFKFMRRMVESMDRHGHGLWDMSTVHVLQNSLQKELAGRVTSFINDIESPADQSKPDTNGQTTPIQNGDDHPVEGPTAAHVHDLKLQLYFDTMLLSNASTNKETKQNQLQEVAERLRNSFGSEAGSISKTMDQRAQEYWHRTRLLFGLLAVDTA
ncbi:Vps51/Vps67-domain-containing protein [Aspergillus varians]